MDGGALVSRPCQNCLGATISGVKGAAAKATLDGRSFRKMRTYANEVIIPKNCVDGCACLHDTGSAQPKIRRSSLPSDHG
jgi:hypothetical protein